MRVLFLSRTFPPNLGGLEAVGLLIARALASAGHDVDVITTTVAAGDNAGDRLAIHVNPAVGKRISLFRSADVVVQNQLSLRAVPLSLLHRSKTLVIHHVPFGKAHGGTWWRALAKKTAALAFNNAAVSSYVACQLWGPARVIHNPYDDQVFYREPSVGQDTDVIFVGRLIRSKGVALLLRACAALARDGRGVSVTIVGEGPERERLEVLRDELGLAAVRFVGAVRGDRLRGLLNRHKVIAVPSIWPEPYGIVVLEGLACGCLPVVTEVGGLPEAVGDCGLACSPDDPDAFADRIREALGNTALRTASLGRFEGRKKCHAPSFVSEQYTRIVENSVR